MNVGLIDPFTEEMIREAFDPPVQRIGPSAPFCVLVKDGVAYIMPQINHSANALIDLVERQEGIFGTAPVPFPVN